MHVALKYKQLIENGLESKLGYLILKFFFLTTIFVIITTSTFAHPSKKNSKIPKVAVVLSGGGAKGFAHIGVLKFLENEGIPIDIIVGTSMGSLIGGFYSIGYTADEIEKIVKEQDWEMLLSDNVPRVDLALNSQLLKQRYLLSFSFSDVKTIGLPKGMIQGQNVLNLFCDLASNVSSDTDFNKFPISIKVDDLSALCDSSKKEQKYKKVCKPQCSNIH